MNRNLLFYLLFVLVCVNCEYELRSQDSQEEEETTEEGRAMSSVLYKIVNKYYCSAESSAPSHLIIYGTKSWMFPPQNVNLTLSYPTTNARQKTEDDDNDDFIITGFSVVLYSDSDRSRGFITDGGILKDSIKLMFVSSNVTTLSYQFWLYGVTKRTHDFIETSALYEHNMCT